jgi:hypothetical protein
MSEFVENIQAVGGAVREDYGESTLADRARMVGATALWPPHEFGMETALVAVGTHTFEYTHNVLAVGAAMGGLSLGVETTLAYLIAHNMKSFTGAIASIRERYYPEISEEAEPEAKTEPKVVAEGSLKERLTRVADTGSLALSLGAPGVMLRDASRDPDPDRAYEENKRTGLRIGRSLATFNFALGSMLAGSGWLAEKLGTHAVTDAIINVGKSHITYPAILAAVMTPRIWSMRQARTQRREAAQAAGITDTTTLQAEETPNV